MKNLFVFAVAFTLGAAVSHGMAATPPVQPRVQAPAKPNSETPINVASDKFVADLNGKTGTFQGNVLVTQGDIKMRANVVRVTSVNGKADKVTATGNVVVDSPASGTATGDSGVYSVGPRTVLMTGNVVLKRAKDVMRGAQLTVNLITGQAVLGGGVKAATPGAPGGTGRVQGVFTPGGDTVLPTK